MVVVAEHGAPDENVMCYRACRLETEPSPIRIRRWSGVEGAGIALGEITFSFAVLDAWRCNIPEYVYCSYLELSRAIYSYLQPILIVLLIS